MRFICLTSLTMKSETPTADLDYDKIKRSTRNYVGLNGVENPRNIKAAINEFKEYDVTDVSIEFLKNVPDGEKPIDNFKVLRIVLTPKALTDVTTESIKNVPDRENTKNKEFEITTWWFSFERNKILLEIKMQPGSIIIKEIDRVKHLIRLEFPKAAEENFPIWISEVSMRFLNVLSKETKRESIMRDNYKAYLKDVQQYITDQRYDEEEAFEHAKKSYEKEKSDKALRQCMTDIKAAITDLCYCPIGSTPKLPKNARYKGESLWQKSQSLTITTRNEYHAYINKSKDNMISLQFNFVKVSLLDTGWFTYPYFNDLLYINVKFLDTSLQGWTQFSKCLSTLVHLLILRISANLDEIPDIVFQSMPDCIMHLDLTFNRLTKISPYISRLKQLQGLYLDDNKNLDSDGIPWKSLPITIETLNFDKTAIKSIPPDIQRLISLQSLSFSFTHVENIPWTMVNSNIKRIFGTFSDFTEINSSNFPHLELLDVRNAEIWQLPIWPSSLQELNLITMNIHIFNISPDYNQLHSINLSNNKLTSFPWNAMPPNLTNLDLSKNLFQKLESMKYWIRLKYLNMSSNHINYIECDETLSFNNEDDVTPNLKLYLLGNQLQALPLGFENCIQIAELDISFNKFAYDTLTDSLWNRLPKFLQSLSLDGLDLRTLPCILKNFPLKELHVTGCNLHYICPQLSRCCEPFLFLDAQFNATLKHLSFLPKKVFPPPEEIEYVISKNQAGLNKRTKSKKQKTAIIKASKDIECYDYEEKWENFGGNASHPIKVITDITDPKGKEFQYDKEDKLILSFKKSRMNKKTQKYYCQCCANCGTETEVNIVEQLMTMDFPLFKEVKKCSFEGKSNKKKPSTPTHIELFKAEKWKTEIKTGLCKKCLEWYKIDAKRIEKIIIDADVDEKDDTQQPSKKSRLEVVAESDHEDVEDEDMEEYEDEEEIDEEMEDEDDNNDDEESEDECSISMPPSYQYNEPYGSSSRANPAIVQDQQIQPHSFQHNIGFPYLQSSQSLFPPIIQYSHQQPQNTGFYNPATTADSSHYQPSSECQISYVLFDPSKATDDELKNL